MGLGWIFKKTQGYIPLNEIDEAFRSDSRMYEPIGNEIILVFDVPKCVAASPVLDIIDEIRNQTQERARSNSLHDPQGETPPGFARLLVTLQGTSPGDEFGVLQDHLNKCVAAAELPFTFKRLSIELAF